MFICPINKRRDKSRGFMLFLISAITKNKHSDSYGLRMQDTLIRLA